ncbi:MAG: NUDIX hydrolase [Chloroflexota bacterium]|nr:NUDIX hydrolase [Chloroflexota bacterium]MDQ5864903.1 NUDIX hydrolase [Chloroflexota bacterium]
MSSTPDSKPNTVAFSEFSAGGVVYRRVGDTYEVVAVHRNRHTDWSLPKGHIEKGETQEQAALREVKEETGLDARIVDALGEVVYFYRRPKGLTRKVVYHFLMEHTGGEFGPPNWEVDQAQWIDIDQAHTLFTYKNDLGIVQKAKEKLTET